MQLKIVENNNLYCTFTEADINKYFSMTFDEFAKNQEVVEKFSDVIIGKAVKTGAIKVDEGQMFDICLYQMGGGKYSIYIKQKEIEESTNV